MSGDRRPEFAEDLPAVRPGADQAKAAGERLQEEAYERGDTGQRPDRRAEMDESLKPKSDTSEKERLLRLQETLAQLIPTVDDSILADFQKEQKEGRFGPATAKALELSVKWLKANVTDTLAVLDKQGLPIPAGCPVLLPRDSSGLPVIDSFYRSQVHQRRLSADLSIDASAIPSRADIDKLTSAALWMSEATRLISTTTRRYESERLARVINDLHRPDWLPPKDATDEQLRRWHAAAAPMVDLSMKVRNYAEAVSSLHMAGGTFPKDAIASENFPGQLKFDDKGKIVEIKLDLPSDLRQTPENAAKIKRLHDWLAKYHEKVDQAIEELVKAAADENRLIIWEDLPSAGKIKVDAKGDVIPDLVKDNTQGTEKSYNLIECRFDVETLPDGRIKVKNSRQYQVSHWYNYLDIGADNVGNVVRGEERIYNPYDFVPVVKGGKIEIMRADKLADWKFKQQAWHYGEKAATVALDVGMIVTGTIEIGAAYRAARAGELAFRAAVGQALKGSFRVALGGTGILNNAAIKETEFGRNALAARGFVMLADVTYGLGKSALGWVRGAKGLDQAATTASIIDKTVKNSSWAVRAMDRASKAGFLMADCVYVPVIGAQIKGQIDTIAGNDQKPHLDDAVTQRGGGMGRARPDTAAAGQPSLLDSARGVISGYTDTLRSASGNERLSGIGERTAAVLALPESDSERQKHRQALIETFRSAGSDEEKIAAAAGLLYLSRKADGSLPESLGRYTEVDKPTGRETVRDLPASEAIAFIKSQVETSSSRANRLVAGEMLVRLGAISGQQYAGVLQDILADPGSSRELKMRAMIDENGPRIGIILDALRAAEMRGLTGSSTEERLAQLGASYGLTASDLENSLLRAAADPQNDADVRAMATAVVHALNRDDVSERAAMLKQLGETWRECQAAPAGTFASRFLGRLTEDLKAQADPLDADGAAVAYRKYLAAAALAVSKLDGPAAPAVNEVLAASLSRTDADLSLQALRHLLPERINTLPAGLARQVRAEALAILEAPTNSRNAAAKLAIIADCGRLFVNAEQSQKSALASQLEAIISPAQADGGATLPEFRAAAIAALASLGSRGSIPLILERLRADVEPAPAVRLAALSALADLKTPGLRRLAMESLDRETDPAVAARLRAVEAAGAELDPSSLDYREAYLRAKTELFQSTRRNLTGSPAWIRANYKFLDGEEFRYESWKRANDIYDHFGGNAHYLYDAVANWDLDIDDKKWQQARDSVRKEMESQFDALVEKARGSGADSEEARKALTYLVLSNGRPALEKWRDWAAARAADGLASICQPGTAGRAQAVWAVENALINQPRMHRVARGNLLVALNRLVDGQPPVVGREEAGRVVAAALELEYRSMPPPGSPGFDESRELQLSMLNHIRNYGNSKVLPVLEAMAAEHPMADVQKRAAELAHQFKPGQAAAAGRLPPGDAQRQEQAAILAHRPDFTGRDYKEKFEKAKAELIKATYRSTEKSTDWIRSNYQLLDGDKLRSERKARADAVYGHLGGTAHYLWDAVTSWDSDIDEKRWQAAYAEVNKECVGQFNSMIEHAKGNGNGSDEARKALVEIVHSNGRPFLEVDRNWAVATAARALYDICKEGAPGRGDVVWAIETSLVNQPNIDKSAKLTLLYGLTHLAGGKNPAVSQAEAATVIAAALESEYQAMPKAGEAGYEESKKLQLEMLSLIERYNHRKIYPVLEAVIAGHPMPEVKDRAGQILSRMRDSYVPILFETKPDEVSSLEKRAEDIGVALKTKDVDQTCAAIFAACRTRTIVSDDDPRRAVLHSALTDSSEKVRVAAAWALLSSTSELDVDAAMNAIAAIATAGTRSGYRSDAQLLVDWVKKRSPSFSRSMERKMEQAKKQPVRAR